MLDGILVGLSSIVVLQFEGSKRKTVDEYNKVYLIGVLGRIPHLSDDTEDILLVSSLGTRIELRRKRVIEVEGIAIELISFAKHIHDSPLAYFPRQASKEFQSLGGRGKAHGLLHLVGLGSRDKAFYPTFHQGKSFIIIVRSSLLIAILISQPIHDNLFKTCF